MWIATAALIWFMASIPVAMFVGRAIARMGQYNDEAELSTALARGLEQELSIDGFGAPEGADLATRTTGARSSR